MGEAISIIAIVLAAACSTALWFISARYAPRLAGQERVVMNWSFNGEPNSYASPRVALSLTPAIGTLSLLAVGAGIAFATPEDSRLLALPVILLAGMVLAAIHAAHMHFAARYGDDRKDERAI